LYHKKLQSFPQVFVVLRAFFFRRQSKNTQALFFRGPHTITLLHQQLTRVGMLLRLPLIH
jgi:hypothetical protein